MMRPPRTPAGARSAGGERARGHLGMNAVGALGAGGVVSLGLSGVAGGEKDEPPKPEPAASAAAAAHRGRGGIKPNVRNPMGPMAKIDPQAMKDYRLDICHYGTLSLRQARDAYFASLGKEEPSEKKI